MAFKFCFLGFWCCGRRTESLRSEHLLLRNFFILAYELGLIEVSSATKFGISKVGDPVSRRVYPQNMGKYVDKFIYIVGISIFILMDVDLVHYNLGIGRAKRPTLRLVCAWR